MSLLILNGSPRGKSSNSALIASWFLDGYMPDAKALTTHFLNKVNHHDDYVKSFVQSDDILMVFPLYVDGMPAQVKHFIEKLAQHKDLLKGKNVIYIIHSGFSEGIQNKTLETYLVNLSRKLAFKHGGVIVIPGSEGFRIMNPNMTKKKHATTSRLAKQYKQDIPLAQKDLFFLRGNETTSKTGIIFFSLLSKLGLTNIYWNSQLKKNKAFDKRFDAPYLRDL